MFINIIKDSVITVEVGLIRRSELNTSLGLQRGSRDSHSLIY
jgi:hypothetical protein